MKVTKISQLSGKVNTIELNATEEQFAMFKAGTPVQDAFPHLDEDQLQFVLSGIMPDEWTMPFGNPNGDLADLLR
jgi:hypothetical protein